MTGTSMEWLDVLERIEAGENRTTEFERGLDLSAVGKAICAFANTEGGVVIFGVDDSRTIVGVRKDPGQIRERLAALLRIGCGAPVYARGGWHEDSNGWVHWLEVPRQCGLEPFRYDGRVWVRRERGSVEPSPIELQELYAAFGCVLTEQSAILAGQPADIDLDKFHSYLRALGFDAEEEPQSEVEEPPQSEVEEPPRSDVEEPSQSDVEVGLRNRGVLRKLLAGGALHPTLYGALAFGTAPQRYPQTRSLRVECVQYGGDDRASRVLQVADAAGRIDDQVQRATGWLMGLRRSESYDGLVRNDRPLLPQPVIREALVNAVVHRGYALTGSKVLLEVFSGHVDVTSPGALPNRITTESVRAGGHPRTRNESLANFMQTMGFMEKRGRGWLVMRRAMRSFNDTEPELIHDPDSKFVRVRFHLD